MDNLVFKNWFKNNLIIGGFPYHVNTDFNEGDYDVVVNVSDEFYPDIQLMITMCGCKYHWFPMNETKRDNGINSIYGAMYILWLAEQKNQMVYLHCHGGLHRSQVVRAAYYFMRTKTHLEHRYYSFINALLSDCARNYLPPREQTEAFLIELFTTFNTMNKMGGILDLVKCDTIK